MLVTLEGLDGSGKSTVHQALRDKFQDATFTREPTETWYGQAVTRSIGTENADSVAELFLYTADHAAHLAETIRPALDQGELVISDRYSDSRYAYQGVTLEGQITRPMEYIRRIHETVTRPPDLTIYLDIDAQTAADRAGATNKFERVEYLAEVRDNYERLIDAEPDRFVRIDATQSPETVTAHATHAIKRHSEE